MKKLTYIGVLAAILSSCTISYDFVATNNPIGSKVGSSQQKYLFGTIPLKTSDNYGSDIQDAGYQTACKNGGISKVGLAETQVVQGPFVTKITTTVYGN
tara:strand:+ start:348 stop:644 length:297 start_codon:yes stop_codon:yes gene_type:complete